MSASDSTLEIDASEATVERTVPVRKRIQNPAPKPSSPAAKKLQTTAAPPATVKGKAKEKIPPAPPDDETEAVEEATERKGWRALIAMPPWLVSAAVHLVVMLVLALIVMPPEPKPKGTMLSAVTAEQETELLATTNIEVIELQETEVITTAVSSSDLTSASLADVGALSAAPTAVSAGDLEVAATHEIGDLFTGDSGKRMGVAIDGAAKGAAQFFGVKATGRRFVFIVDSSNSMRGAKFEAAKEELMYAIRRLSRDQAFYIVFFDHDADRMKLPPNTEPELLCVPATTENINKADQWVKTVINEGRTDPYDAVKFALDIVPDAIYLLTDGIFTDRGQTERFLKANNILNDAIDGTRPKVVVHTVCFWDRAGEEPLQRIAKDYNGTYRYVPPAGRKN